MACSLRFIFPLLSGCHGNRLMGFHEKAAREDRRGAPSSHIISFCLNEVLQAKQAKPVIRGATASPEAGLCDTTVCYRWIDCVLLMNVTLCY